MNPATRISSLLAASAAVFLVCLAPRPLSAAITDPVVLQLQADVVALRNRVIQLEASRPQVSGGVVVAPASDLAARVKQLGDQLAVIGSAISIGPAGVSIAAQNISLQAAQGMSLSASNGLQLQAAQMQLAATASLQVKSVGTAAIGGAMLLLNGGGSPIITMRSPQGSATVLAP